MNDQDYILTSFSLDSYSYRTPGLGWAGLDKDVWNNILQNLGLSLIFNHMPKHEGRNT